LTQLSNKAITVFVGNISASVPDAVLREILQKCGRIVSWKRMTGASMDMARQALG
jgi:RNA-binding protein 25